MVIGRLMNMSLITVYDLLDYDDIITRELVEG